MVTTPLSPIPPIIPRARRNLTGWEVEKNEERGQRVQRSAELMLDTAPSRRFSPETFRWVVTEEEERRNKASEMLENLLEAFQRCRKNTW